MEEVGTFSIVIRQYVAHRDIFEAIKFQHRICLVLGGQVSVKNKSFYFLFLQIFGTICYNSYSLLQQFLNHLAWYLEKKFGQPGKPCCRLIFGGSMYVYRNCQTVFYDWNLGESYCSISFLQNPVGIRKFISASIWPPG